jgi:hypothetical protein
MGPSTELQQVFLSISRTQGSTNERLKILSETIHKMEHRINRKINKVLELLLSSEEYSDILLQSMKNINRKRKSNEDSFARKSNEDSSNRKSNEESNDNDSVTTNNIEEEEEEEEEDEDDAFVCFCSSSVLSTSCNNC